MSVLFLNPTATLGGAERVLLAMTAALRRQHPALPVHVLTLDEGPLTGMLAAQGIGVTCLPLPRQLARLGDSQLALGRGAKLELGLQGIVALPALGGFLRRLRVAVRRVRPTLLHSNGIKTHLLARLAGLDALPLLWHIHDFFGARPLARRLLGWAARRLRVAIAISEAVAADFRAVAGACPVLVVANAIDTTHFHPGVADADRLDRLSGLPSPPTGTLRVGLVATYARWKGHDVFLKAAAALVQETSSVPVRFYIVGGPVYQTPGSQYNAAELHSLVGALGLAGRIGFVDFQSDPSDIYRALDVVVHASTRPEPFGLTIVEAMACGRPVIAAQAGGAAELFTHDHDGLGVAPGVVGALAGALRRLLRDGALRARLGANARATARSRFDVARLGPQLDAVYRRVLSAPTEADLPRSFSLSSSIAQSKP